MSGNASPHLLIAGQSGSGKTVFLELFSSLCVRDLPGCQLYRADPKMLDTNFAKGSPRLWQGMDAPQALEAFHASMMSRINGEDTSENFKILVFDEFAAMGLLVTDTKQRKAIMDMWSATLLLARATRHVVICLITLIQQHAR